MSRISKDEWFMELARVVALRGTCARRKVGCVLANSKGHVIATGYNGVARGVVHCTARPCPGLGMASGTGLDLCAAIHAEQNALLQCRDVDDIRICYTTTEPCAHCAKLLLNTGCEIVIYDEAYTKDKAGLNQWLLARREHTWMSLKAALQP